MGGEVKDVDLVHLLQPLPVEGPLLAESLEAGSPPSAVIGHPGKLSLKGEESLASGDSP